MVVVVVVVVTAIFNASTSPAVVLLLVLIIFVLDRLPSLTVDTEWRRRMIGRMAVIALVNHLQSRDYLNSFLGRGGVVVVVILNWMKNQREGDDDQYPS